MCRRIYRLIFHVFCHLEGSTFLHSIILLIFIPHNYVKKRTYFNCVCHRRESSATSHSGNTNENFSDELMPTNFYFITSHNSSCSSNQIELNQQSLIPLCFATKAEMKSWISLAKIMEVSPLMSEITLNYQLATPSFRQTLTPKV